MEKAEKIRLLILAALVGAVFSTLGVVIADRIRARDDTVHKAASVEYVDKQDAVICNRVSTVENDLKQKADKTDVNEQFERIDKKLDNIYNILITKQ